MNQIIIVLLHQELGRVSVEYEGGIMIGPTIAGTGTATLIIKPDSLSFPLFGVSAGNQL